VTAAGKAGKMGMQGLAALVARRKRRGLPAILVDQKSMRRR